MLRRFWLFFAQAVTVLLALMFIVATLKPQWLQRQGQFGKQLAEPIVALREVAPGIGSGPAQASYADAAQKAMPAVVNVSSAMRPLARLILPGHNGGGTRWFQAATPDSGSVGWRRRKSGKMRRNG